MNHVNAFLRRIPTAVVWCGGLIPLLSLIYLTVTNDLGADPVQKLEHELGETALQFLVVTLAITPLRMTGLNLIKFRRAFGVLAFIYAALHLLTWVFLDLGLRWGQIAEDLYKRPYIILGMVSFLAMLPLAVTSTNRLIRLMGPVRWRRLHRLVYVAGVAAVLHYIILVKGWQVEPLVYGAVVFVLLGLRLVKRKAR